ncbi:hypothetical protein NM688_g6623 [Phlebia brevispora]|uniref:Uncharacterized protein n=1 Tax=Phlebia brevispora TaxID=194682 RepID=A0ACC1SE78_9APHY|nr:hypothetical protein NM688_g6623 [Phlebia brevispora]
MYALNSTSKLSQSPAQRQSRPVTAGTSISEVGMHSVRHVKSNLHFVWDSLTVFRHIRDSDSAFHYNRDLNGIEKTWKHAMTKSIMRLAHPEDCSLTVVDQLSIAALSRAAVHKMMDLTNISVRDVRTHPAGELVQSIRETLARWNLQVEAPEKLEQYILFSAQMAKTVYGYLKTDVQLQIALYTFLAFRIDDLVLDNGAAEEFATRLCAGKPQLDPLLDCLAEVLEHMVDCYLPYAAQAIIVSTIQALNFTAFDKDTESMVLHGSAISFPQYRRMANGAGEAYAFFAWDKFTFPDVRSFVQAVPDVSRWFCYVNDVFSFYKEELAGERNNYVHDLSTVTGKDISTVLFDVVEDVASTTQRARAVLKGHALDAMEKFMQGYTYFFFIAPRYKVNHYLDVESFIAVPNARAPTSGGGSSSSHL